jgi:preprotein translocase subunit SecA
MLKVLKQLFGSLENQKLRKFQKTVEIINSLEAEFVLLSNEQLKDQTNRFKNELKQGSNLTQILPKAFATVREASKRVLGMRHFDVQLLGGLVLYHGGIAEMATGEGKTLVVTTAAYLRSLESMGMHIVTVNDYLAQRDASWMGEIFKFLQVSVGCITSGMDDESRKAAYQCDITYATNNELGFDFLRDNTKYDFKDKVQRKLHAACIDEIDSILIDEARTPLILSGPSRENLATWRAINSIVTSLDKEHYCVDEKMGTASLSEEGTVKIEQLLCKAGLLKEGTQLYDMENANLVYQINQSLRARTLFHKDVDYIVKEARVLCINRNTGRISEGRRYGGGLHQAIEAKECVPVREENEEIASITFQNYFRTYPHLAGMTGTAATEAEEFKKIYNLSVYSIPTHRPLQRKDQDDMICATTDAKHQAILELVEERHKAGQPILLGTGDIQQSEDLSSLLSKSQIKHAVLNAKNHAQEASIIAQAGCLKRVTIATNMAGRGTDIMLGGNAKMMFAEYLANNPTITDEEKQKKSQELYRQCLLEKQEVLEAGGLFVIGALRHDSRRIDNQLRGRSGRQGDPGVSKFFLSLDDNLIKLFASEKNIAFLRKRLDPEGGSINHPLANMAIATAQKRVENQYYESRQHLLKFDNVINEQRILVYQQRDSFLASDDESAKNAFFEIAQDLLLSTIESFTDESECIIPEMQDQLLKKCRTTFGVPETKDLLVQNIKAQKLLEALISNIKAEYLSKEEKWGKDEINHSTKLIQISTLDQVWREHIAELAVVKEAIQNRAYAQKDPLNEYKSEAFNSFKTMLERFSALFVQRVCLLEMDDAQKSDAHQIGQQKNVRRNQLCPCGSDKKYKHCHGMKEGF